MTVETPADNAEQTPLPDLATAHEPRPPRPWRQHVVDQSRQVIWLRLRPEARAIGWAWLKVLIMRPEPHRKAAALQHALQFKINSGGSVDAFLTDLCQKASGRASA
jgi:hypothetical protein